MKLIHALLPVALIGSLALAGCTGGSDTDSTGKDCVASGDASDSVEVDGTAGDDLKLTSKTPVKAKSTQRSVLKEGKGDAVGKGEQIQVAATVFNGAKGDVIQQMPESAMPFEKAQLSDWAYDAMRCAVPGQQIVIVTPFTEVYGDSTDPSSLGLDGLSKTDSLVIVMDFGKVSKAEATTSGEPGELSEDKLLKKAEGTAQKTAKGLPTVKLAKNGEPAITVPKGAKAPSKLTVEPLIKGEGEEVKAGDRVYVQYTGIIWRTGKTFDSSWESGQPANFVTSQVIPGFTKALVGQKVGSQVMSIVPPEDGYGDNLETQLKGANPDFDVKNSDDLVFVLDILGTVHADSK